MKKVSKALCSFVLAMIISLNTILPCFAAEETAISEESILAIVEQLYPGSVIHISENGTINVALLEEPIRTKSSFHAPAGGSYRNFVPPFGYNVATLPVPYSKVFLPQEQTFALYQGMVTDNLFNQVIEWAASGLSYLNIQDYIKAKFNLNISIAGIVFLIGIGSFEVIQWLDTVAMNTAVSKSKNGSISIMRTTVGGYPTNIYTPWDSSYVNDNPYENFNPTWHKGVYDIE